MLRLREGEYSIKSKDADGGLFSGNGVDIVYFAHILLAGKDLLTVIINQKGHKRFRLARGLGSVSVFGGRISPIGPLSIKLLMAKLLLTC